MARHLTIALPLLLLLAGCKVGPNYRPPQTAVSEESFGPLPEKTTAQPYQTTNDPSRIEQWWTSLDDPALNSLIEDAVKANRDLRVATARVLEARARSAIAGAALYPAVNLDAGYTYNRFSLTAAPYNAFNVPGFPWSFNLYQAGFDASWEADVFGGIRRGVEAANADLQASVESSRSVLVSVLAEVALNYVELRGYQQGYLIAEHNLDLQRQMLELTRDRAQKGTAAQLAVTRSATQVSTTEAILPRLRNLEWQAMHRIAVLTGQEPGALVKELSLVKPVPVPPSRIAVGIPAELLRRRPDIRRAERELAAATARVGVAAADLYPRFSLSGVFDVQTSDLHDIEENSQTYSFGPGIQWPIFNAGRLRAALQARNAQEQQALAGYEQSVLRAMEEVHDALSSFVTEQDRSKSLQDAVQSAQQAADLSEEQYIRGTTDFSTVLDAQRQLCDSQEALLQSRTAVTVSLIALYKALGGGWETSASADPAAPAQTRK